jgi:predicted DNA-binding protein
MIATQQLAVRIPVDLYRRLKAYSRETGVPITRLVERWLRAALAEKPSTEAKV